MTTYTYDAVGRQIGMAYPNGVQAVSTYDDADRLLSLVHTSPVSGVIASAIYTLDAAGNRLTMTDLDGLTTYAYDTLHRLTGVTYPDGEQVTYTYDPMGNRLSMTSNVKGTTAYTYDTGDRLLSFSGPGGAVNLAWDANGNMTAKGAAAYTFDAFNRLTQVVSSTTTVQFAYTGDSVRVGKLTGSANVTYVQDVAGALPVVLVENTGSQATQYVYGADLLAEVDGAGTTSFHHADGLGSTRALSNQAGQGTDRYSYDVFGATRSHNGGSAQFFTYTGEQVDGELGLVFLRARYYDPQVGRFLSRDPVWGLADFPDTLNRYPYAKNNPAVYIDADGEFVIEAIAIALIGYGIYKGLEEFAQQADRWGNAYGDVLNTAGNPDQQEGDYEHATEKFRLETQNLQKQTLKTAITMPGTSLTGPIGVPGSWKGLAFDVSIDKVKNWFYDHLIGIDSKSGKPGKVLSSSDTTYWSMSPYPVGGEGGGSWSRPPSGGK